MELVQQHKFMRLEKDGKKAWVTFSRKRYLNAMNNACTVQISRIAKALREDPDVRVIIIRGEGRAFCTGIDLKELANDRIEMDYHHRWESALRIFQRLQGRAPPSRCWGRSRPHGRHKTSPAQPCVG